ncbi:MAG: tyrosine recombinase XerC [Patescibacteria group bacterium]|nr:MAG: tyrosine recombinase XerC [Patescibacteria group bacterium]
MKLSEAIEKFYKWKKLNVKEGTINGYDLILRQFCVFMRDCEIENISLDDIVKWFELMKQLGWDQNSFIPKTIALRKFFEFYIHQGYRVIDPFLIPLPQKQFKLPRVADEKTYKKLLTAIPRKTNDPRHIRNLAIITMLYDTGARNGEIVSLNISDVDTKRMRAVIKTEKAKTRRPIREIFWTRNTNENLKKWIKKRDHLKRILTFKDPEALFISTTNSKAGYRFTIKGVGEMIRKYCNRAKIPYLNPHSFRHKLGHDLANKNYNNSVISNILGHSSLQSSYIYTLMTDKELEAKYREARS